MINDELYFPPHEMIDFQFFTLTLMKKKLKQPLSVAQSSLRSAISLTGYSCVLEQFTLCDFSIYHPLFVYSKEEEIFEQ